MQHTLTEENLGSNTNLETIDSRSVLMRWGILGFALAPILGAFSYNFGLRLEMVRCLFRAWLDFPCPSCGLTRSFLALARGDWQQALMYHAFGPVLFILSILTIGQTTIEIVRGRSIETPFLLILRRRMFLLIATALLLGYYGLRLYVRYNALILPFGWSETIVWQSFVVGSKAL